MKRNILLFLMVQPICVVLVDAQTEHYGASSGTQGDKSSYFGYNGKVVDTKRLILTK
jgi:hypothetical protein